MKKFLYFFLSFVLLTSSYPAYSGCNSDKDCKECEQCDRNQCIVPLGMCTQYGDQCGDKGFCVNCECMCGDLPKCIDCTHCVYSNGQDICQRYDFAECTSISACSDGYTCQSCECRCDTHKCDSLGKRCCGGGKGVCQQCCNDDHCINVNRGVCINGECKNTVEEDDVEEDE